MISVNTGLQMQFTEEQLKEIENLAALNYSVRQVAMYFNLKISDLFDEYQDNDSAFRYHYDRGQLVAQAQIDAATLDSAKKGNITAALRYDKKARENKLSQAKNRIFGRS